MIQQGDIQRRDQKRGQSLFQGAVLADIQMIEIAKVTVPFFECELT
jgi:hypothetical protein